MKQIIVLVGMVALGIALSGLLMNLQDGAQALITDVNSKISSFEITQD